MHQRVAAEPEHPGPPPNDQPLYPLPRPGRIHAQVQPVAVAIEPGLGGPQKRGAQAVREAARLLCPVKSMATRSGTFARIRLRAAVRRQS